MARAQRQKKNNNSKHNGLKFSALIALVLFLVGVLPIFKDSLTIHKGRLYHDSSTDTYEVKENADPLQGTIPLNRTWYYLSVMSAIVGLLAGWIYDLRGEMVKKEELTELQEEFEHTRKTFTSGLDQALSLPSENHVNPKAFSEIKEIIRDEVIQKIQNQFFRKHPDVLEFDVVLQTLKKMLSGLGAEIDASGSKSGLPVEDLAWSNDTRSYGGTPSFKRDYPDFVAWIIREHTIEFRGVSLMPPCMWTDIDDKFGLANLINEQKKRIAILKEQGEITSPRFERILLCPSELVGEEKQMLEDMRRTHAPDMKLKVIGMANDSKFDYARYTSDDYCDYVLVKCRCTKNKKEKWFAITSLGFNKLRRWK